MSYANIVNAIDEINASIVGIRKTYKYEPMRGIVAPCIYTLLGDADIAQRPSTQQTHYRILMRLLLSYSSTERCEEQLAEFVDKILKKYQQNVKLNNKVLYGSAEITAIRGAYLEIGGVIYRMAEFTLEVYEREAVTFATKEEV